MICADCLWEAALRKRVRSGKRVRLPRPNVLARKGHATCPGGSWCFCQHRGTPYAVNAGVSANAK